MDILKDIVGNIPEKPVTSLIKVLENITHDVSSEPRGEICAVTVFSSSSWLPKV